MTPLLSIVIPTRNRAFTAYHCARATLRMTGDDFEVVVRDCSDTDTLRTQLAELNDPRLVYEHGAPCSMTDNWNAAMRLTTGRFICYLGDDDGFMPWGLEVLRRQDAIETVHCIASDPLRTVYHWPDFSIAGQEALLVFERFPQMPRLHKQSAKETLTETLRGPSRIPMPGVYHRIASRTLMEEIRAGSGDYFQTLIPDFFTYFASCTILDSYHIVDPPLSIAGSCGSSNSSKATKNRVDFSYHRAEYGEYRGKSTDLEPICGMHGMIADSVEVALRAFAADDVLHLFRSSYVPMSCGTASCEAPLAAASMFLGMQRHALEGLSASGRIAATIAYGKELIRFTWRHGDYTLRKMGLYTPAYNKALHRFEKIEDIATAIDIVQRVTLAGAL